MASVSVKRNDNFRAIFYFIDGDEAANLSGCTARMQIRDSKGAVLVEASTDDYLTIDGGAGTVTANIPGAEMSIATGKHVSDVELTYTDGTIRSSSTFNVKVLQDITRDD